MDGFDELVLIDDLRTQRLSSMFDLPQPYKFSLVEADVRETDLVRLLGDAEVVVHLAATTDAESSSSKPEATLENNLGSTEKLVEACVATNTRLVFPSSTSVYGAQEKIVSEELGRDGLNPQSPYAKSKLMEEESIRQVVARGLLNATVFRFGTIFGTSPGMRFHTAVNKFCWQARFGIPLTVWSTARHQMRPYLAIEDSVNAIKHAISHPNKFAGVTNVVTNNYSVEEVVSIIRAYVPNLEVRLVTSPIMNQLSYQVANNKSLASGIEYRGELEGGIRQTLRLLGVERAH